MTVSPDELRQIYRRTVIVRKPTYGIVRGYHELPYICLGASFNPGTSAMRVRGKVHVSPKLLLRPKHYDPSYEDIFGEDNVDGELAGRVFGFLGFPDKPVECTSEFLDLKFEKESVDQLLSHSLEELDRQEDISTGVLITPNSRYFPVSIERFISSILDDEFAV